MYIRWLWIYLAVLHCLYSLCSVLEHLGWVFVPNDSVHLDDLKTRILSRLQPLMCIIEEWLNIYLMHYIKSLNISKKTISISQASTWFSGTIINGTRNGIRSFLIAESFRSRNLSSLLKFRRLFEFVEPYLFLFFRENGFFRRRLGRLSSSSEYSS